MSQEADITILGGLPVTIEFVAYGAEPDVGIMGTTIDEWRVVAINGRTCKKEPTWLYSRIEKTKGETERIEDKLVDFADSYEPDYDYEPDAD